MNKYVAALITWFVGVFGVHRFMAGKIGTGILWLCTAGCCGVGVIVDVIMILMDKFTDKDGNIWPPVQQ